VRGTAVGVGMVQGGAEAGYEREKKKERRSSFGGALLLKMHEAVDNGGMEVSAAATVQRWSVQSGHRPGREANDWGPHGFVFSPNYPN
jgi:hypothetical protein